MSTIITIFTNEREDVRLEGSVQDELDALNEPIADDMENAVQVAIDDAEAQVENIDMELAELESTYNNTVRLLRAQQNALQLWLSQQVQS